MEKYSSKNWDFFISMIPDGGMVQMSGLDCTVDEIVDALKKKYPTREITTEDHYLHGEKSGNVIFRIK